VPVLIWGKDIDESVEFCPSIEAKGFGLPTTPPSLDIGTVLSCKLENVGCWNNEASIFILFKDNRVDKKAVVLSVLDTVGATPVFDRVDSSGLALK